jgi:hypothetical protein
MTSSYYHLKDGMHVYNCSYCEWTRSYPTEVVDHKKRAVEAVGAHITKCHPGAIGSVSEEGDFASGFEKLVTAAIDRGVQPGDVLSMIASGYNGMAAGFGLSLDQSLDIVRCWWPVGEPNEKEPVCKMCRDTGLRDRSAYRVDFDADGPWTEPCPCGASRGQEIGL